MTPDPDPPTAAPATGHAARRERAEPGSPWDAATLWLGAGPSEPPGPAPAKSIPEPMAGRTAHDEVLRVRHRLGLVLALDEYLARQAMASVALHAVGTDVTRRLLMGVATARRLPMRRLHLVEAATGETLAVLPFVEAESAAAAPLRVWSTLGIETDDPARSRDLVQVLLARARWGVVVVDGAALADPFDALAPLHQPPGGVAWSSRHLLVLPMGASLKLAAAVEGLALRHAVQAVTAPPLDRPSEIWQRLLATHARLASLGLLDSTHGSRSDDPWQANEPERDRSTRGAGPLVTSASPMGPASRPGAASHWPSGVLDAVADLPLEPDTATASGPAPAPAPRAIDEAAVAATLHRAGRIGGCLAACVFDLEQGQEVAVWPHSDPRGPHLAPGLMGRRAAALLEAARGAARGLGQEPGQPELWIGLADRHLVVWPLARHPGLGLHLMLDRDLANPMLTRMQLQRLDEEGP